MNIFIISYYNNSKAISFILVNIIISLYYHFNSIILIFISLFYILPLGISARLSVDERETTQLVLEIVQVAENNGLKLPREFGLLLKQVRKGTRDDIRSWKLLELTFLIPPNMQQEYNNL